MIADGAVPPDASARERIVTSIDDTLFVDAGAGSGKTTQLVERVVQLVRSGVPIEHLAAITFTEAAAAELRDRIRHRLADAAGEATSDDERATLRDAADRADEASIQTLHAFAQSILRAHPVEAGLPPAVEVADEITSVLAFERRFEEFRDRLFDDDSLRPLLRRFLLLGLKESDLRSLAAVFNDNWDRIPREWDDDHLDLRPLPSLDVTTILEALHEALDLRDQCSDPADKLLEFLDRHVVDSLAMLDRARGDHVLGVLAGLRKFACRYGRQESWNGAKPRILEALEVAEADRLKLLEDNQHVVADSLMRLVGRFVLRSAEQRRVDGRLEFHDLLVRARNLLRDHPDVRRQLAARHQRVLVDEFQDTDPLQLDIVSLIAARDGTGSTEWDEVPIDGGRVFFVGDPKQSIYRFRRADMKLYTDARGHYGDGLCELSANFRTVPGIIDWVNHTFGELIVEGEGQPAYLPLDAVRPPLGDDVAPVTVLGGAITEATANEIRNRSAAELVAVLREMVDAGRTVRDGDATRPMTFGDVVVLVPSRIPVPALEDAFEAADVPYRLETASLIWASQEIREVMSVLRAVDDPGDQISIVAALRTPMLGCSDDDLAAWRTSGGRWSYLSLPEPPDGAGDGAGGELAVASALRTLRSLHDERWWLGPDGLIDRLATDHATFQLALLAGRRRDRWRRLRFLADQARSFVESQRGDLASFVAWAELQSSDIVRVSSPTLPEGDEQAVRVMTIHASKGLEFPVVALFGLGVGLRGYNGVSVFWPVTGPEVRFSTRGGTEGHDALVPAEEQMDRHERMRLLYVAATRAKDRLILCTHHKATKTINPATSAFGLLIEQHLPEDRDDLWARWSQAGAAPLRSTPRACRFPRRSTRPRWSPRSQPAPGSSRSVRPSSRRNGAPCGPPPRSPRPRCPRPSTPRERSTSNPTTSGRGVGGAPGPRSVVRCTAPSSWSTSTTPPTSTPSRGRSPRPRASTMRSTPWRHWRAPGSTRR